MNKILLVFLLVLAPLCYANDLLWFGSDKSKWPDSDSRKTSDDFAGMLLVTPDSDWEEKWSTSSKGVPQFMAAKTVRYGEELSVLIFFMNPKPDDRSNVNIQCSFVVTRPNKTIAVFEQEVACMKGSLQGNENRVGLSPVVLKFVGEKNDPAGTWTVSVDLRDMNRNTTLQLKTRFNLIANDS